MGRTAVLNLTAYLKLSKNGIFNKKKIKPCPQSAHEHQLYLLQCFGAIAVILVGEMKLGKCFTKHD